MSEVRFGPAGIPIGSPEPSTAGGISYCRQIGLGAMEVEFVHGVGIGNEAAQKAGGIAKELGVRLSCHAPYYINCCAKEEKKIERSIQHIVSSARAAQLLGASPVVIHTGHYMGRAPPECKKIVYETYRRCFEIMDSLRIKGVALGAELTGKKSAYGSLEEIVDLSEHFGIGRLVPVVDYAHYHAREKRLEKKEDYAAILSFIEKRLGAKASKNFHCHFSGIAFGEKGEKNHLPIESGSPPALPFLEALAENGWEGVVVCESPLLEEDALKMQEDYLRLANKIR
ncbi:MAG: TIM barrel protein [Candidatus Micrarchaeota archaeon]|nr:TIM barrel protein [Candidatus Micrarchaeota archaeon]